MTIQSGQPTGPPGSQGGHKMRALQIISLATLSGVATLAAIAVGIFCFQDRPGASPAKGDDKLIGLLSLVTIAVTGAAVLAAWIIPRFIISSSARRLAASSAEPADYDSPELLEAFLAGFFPAKVVRLAAMESAAIYGLVVFLLAAMKGRTLNEHPEYWLNLLPAVLHVCYAGMSFPTRWRVRAILARKLAEARERSEGWIWPAMSPHQDRQEGGRG